MKLLNGREDRDKITSNQIITNKLNNQMNSKSATVTDICTVVLQCSLNACN